MHCAQVRELIGIAQCLSLRIQQVPERDIPSQFAYVDFEIQSHVFAAVVKRYDGPTYLVQSCLQIFLLPLPKNVVKIRMMKEEQRI